MTLDNLLGMVIWQVIYGIFSGVCAFVYRYVRPFNRLLCIQIKLPQAQQQHSYHSASARFQ